MYRRLSATYYGLSIFVLATALFVMQPAHTPETAAWQASVLKQMSVSFRQLWGDQPVFADVALVYQGVGEFYRQSSVATVALVQNYQLDSDIAQVWGRVYDDFAFMVNPAHQPVAVAMDVDLAVPTHIDLTNFMSEDPIYDLTPVPTSDAGNVAGIAVTDGPETEPVNMDNPWFTVLDAYTGQKYCMAIYNGEVNKYLGSCKNDYY